jgi:hypothetical protein
LKGAGDQEEEVHVMGAKTRALCGCQVVVAGLFILAIMISAVGCGTNSWGSYRASLQDTGGSRFNMYSGKIEHNLFNGRYQKAEKEDWEDD